MSVISPRQFNSQTEWPITMAIPTVISGRTNAGALRRTFLHFDVAGSIPAQATVTSAMLTVHLDGASQAETQGRDMELHRLTADWGEGTSGGGGAGSGQGSPPTAGDATWLYGMFDTALWTSPGGEFASTASAVTSVGTGIDFYQWQSTAELVDDVQGWLDDPTTNFGLALIGDETQNRTARRFNSRQTVDVSLRPVLAVEFVPVPEPCSALLLVAGSLLAVTSVRRVGPW